MPTYEYLCPACGTSFEELVRTASAAGSVVCPRCGHRRPERQFSVFAAHAAERLRSSRASACDECCRAERSCPLRE